MRGPLGEAAQMLGAVDLVRFDRRGRLLGFFRRIEKIYQTVVL